MYQKKHFLQYLTIPRHQFSIAIFILYFYVFHSVFLQQNWKCSRAAVKYKTIVQYWWGEGNSVGVQIKQRMKQLTQCAEQMEKEIGKRETAKHQISLYLIFNNILTTCHGRERKKFSPYTSHTLQPATWWFSH